MQLATHLVTERSIPENEVSIPDVVIRIVKTGASAKITKLEMTATQRFKLHWNAVSSLDDMIVQMTALAQGIVVQFRPNETRLPTSGTEIPPLYHSEAQIHEAALRKVRECDIPLSSILSQHDYRQKEVEDAQNAPSEDESTRSIYDGETERDFDEDIYQPAPIIVLRPKA
jgi:hypothetical protein